MAASPSRAAGGPRKRPLSIVIIDYESGNLRSVAKALETTGVTPLVTGDPSALATADAVVLPGVGSGPAAMDALRARKLVGPLHDFVKSGKPFLGVCLGLQLLLDHTEEGDAPCLGIVPGTVKRLPAGSKAQSSGPLGQAALTGGDSDRPLKIPHMGWNSVRIQGDHPALKGIPQDGYFYFVHSYYAAPNDETAVAGVTEYSVPFCSLYARDNVVATQFHPEKSGDVGLRFYHNFVDWASSASA